MTEGTTHTRMATARSGRPGPRPLDREAVLAILADVPDPELPVVSIAQLGMVHEVAVTPDGIRVTLLPTFIGCPAIDLIRESVAAALGSLGRPVEVETTYAVPWSSDRITLAGREALRRAGIAPPGTPADLRCPHCGSPDVTLDNLFGPTQCRSILYCRGCHQPFEALKTL